MKLIDIANFDAQLAFLQSIPVKDGRWSAAIVTVQPGAVANIVSAGRIVEKALTGYNGAVLVESPERLMVYAEAAPADAVAQACKGFHCDVLPDEISEPHLAHIMSRLQKSAAPRPRASTHSTLFKHRSQRKENMVMVADDDLLVCAAMKNALGRFGGCTIVHSLNDIVDAYVDAAPDCIFLDLHLADGTGLDAISDLVRYDKDAHIVMLTADAKASNAASAKAKGAKSFVAKPLVLSRVEYELFRCPTFRRYG